MSVSVTGEVHTTMGLWEDGSRPVFAGAEAWAFSVTWAVAKGKTPEATVMVNLRGFGGARTIVAWQHDPDPRNMDLAIAPDWVTILVLQFRPSSSRGC